MNSRVAVLLCALAVVASAFPYVAQAIRAWSGQAKAVLKVHERVEVGKPFEVDGEASTAQTFEWSIDAGGIRPDSTGRRAIASVPRAGKAKVSLEVTSIAGGKLSKHRAELVVDVLPPGSGPGPSPPGPAGDLAAWTTDAVSRLVTSYDKPGESRRLVGVYRDTANRIRAGALREPVEIDEALFHGVETALGGTSYESWSRFLDALQLEMTNRMPRPTLGEVAAALDSVAQGLEAVR